MTVVPFRRARPPDRFQRPIEPPAALSQNAQGQSRASEEDAEDRRRMRQNLAAFALVVVLLVLGAWMIERLRIYSRTMACIESGQRIRITGAGHAGEPGAPTGDLYILTQVADDPRFERRGPELVSVVHVPATKAMLGGTVHVPTLDGDTEMDVPAGAQPGQTFVLPGLGLPSLGSSSRGDQHVIVDVVVPTELSDEQRDLAAELDRALGERASSDRPT